MELDERSGTSVDAEQLKTLFLHLGFDVFIFNDYKVIQVLHELQEGIYTCINLNLFTKSKQGSLHWFLETPYFCTKGH